MSSEEDALELKTEHKGYSNLEVGDVIISDEDSKESSPTASLSELLVYADTKDKIAMTVGITAAILSGLNQPAQLIGTFYVCALIPPSYCLAFFTSSRFSCSFRVALKCF